MKLTSQQLLTKLKAAGSAQTKKTYFNHGAQEPCYGVKVADMKKIMKGVDRDTTVALELFKSGVFDAMYFAGLYGDGSTMTTKQLDELAKTAYGGWASEFSVPWLATENAKGFELALKWIDTKKESITSSGWGTLTSWVANKPDSELDIKKLKTLLVRVEKEIHKAPNRVRYMMNSFVVAVGSYVKTLSADASAAAKRIGPVTVIQEGTQCKVPSAVEYIEKAKARGSLNKKRTNIKC